MLVADLLCGPVVQLRHAVYLCREVMRAAARREFLHIGAWMEGEAADYRTDPKALVSEAIRKLQALRTGLEPGA